MKVGQKKKRSSAPLQRSEVLLVFGGGGPSAAGTGLTGGVISIPLSSIIFCSWWTHTGSVSLRPEGSALRRWLVQSLWTASTGWQNVSQAASLMNMNLLQSVAILMARQATQDSFSLWLEAHVHLCVIFQRRATPAAMHWRHCSKQLNCSEFYSVRRLYTRLVHTGSTGCSCFGDASGWRWSIFDRIKRIARAQKSSWNDKWTDMMRKIGNCVLQSYIGCRCSLSRLSVTSSELKPCDVFGSPLGSFYVYCSHINSEVKSEVSLLQHTRHDGRQTRKLNRGVFGTKRSAHEKKKIGILFWHYSASIKMDLNWGVRTLKADKRRTGHLPAGSQQTRQQQILDSRWWRHFMPRRRRSWIGARLWSNGEGNSCVSSIVPWRLRSWDLNDIRVLFCFVFNFK